VLGHWEARGTKAMLPVLPTPRCWPSATDQVFFVFVARVVLAFDPTEVSDPSFGRHGRSEPNLPAGAGLSMHQVPSLRVTIADPLPSRVRFL